MNQQLEEFNKLRLVYSGRIDDAIRLDDKEDLDKAKEEYNNIISKYLDVACDVLSSHTNKPFTLYQVKKGKKRLKSSKIIKKDINDIRDSMEKIKLSNEDKIDIKSAINVISDYYNKVIIDDNEVSHKDNSDLQFRLIFSIFIVPIIITLISMFNIFFINKFSSVDLYYLLTSFLSLNVKVLIKNSFSTGLMLQYLLLIIVDLGSLFILYKIFSNECRKGIFDNKKFLIIPACIIKTLLFFTPFNIILQNNLYGLEVITLIILLSNIFLVIIILFSILSSDYSSGDYKTPLNIIEAILLVIMILTILVPFIYNLIGNYIDLTFINNNFIVKNILLNNSFLSVIKYIYIILTLVTINIEVYQNNKNQLIKPLITIVISLIILCLCIYLNASGNTL